VSTGAHAAAAGCLVERLGRVKEQLAPLAAGGAVYFLRHQSNMPPMRPPVSNAFFCFSSRLS
jgi:hypothetical protein